MINNNMKQLFEQFCKAYGIKNADIYDKELVNAFFEWFMEPKIAQDAFYREQLNCMGLDIDDSKTIEVGKTVHDSIVLPYKTTIVTPDGTGFENYKDRVIVANLKFHGKFPTLIQQRGSMTHAIPVDLYQTFMTQNPYDKSEIENWERFPYQNVVVGVYGGINDKDVHEKIRQMDEFYQRLNPEFNPRKDFISENNCYAEIVTTDRKIR